jgi:crotonobetaine/carnitine-CoA ligase
MPDSQPVPDLPVLTRLVADRAAATPGRMFVVETGGRSVSYGEMASEAKAWARGLASLGLGPGDVVCSMRAASASGVAAWLGTAKIGAIDAGIAVSYRGELLHSMLAKGRVLVIDADCVQQILPLTSRLQHLLAIVVTGDGEFPALPELTVVTEKELLARDFEADLIDPKPWDTGCLTHTSGTTGPSKAVLLPWGHLYSFATALFDPAELTEDDAFYSPMPMNHIAQRVQTYLMAIVGGRVVVRNAFSASEYWSDVRTYGCTITNVSVGAKILFAMPPAADDATVPLRMVLMSPLIPEYREFGSRFGLEVRTMFGSTEVGLPIISAQPPPNALTSGRRNTRFPYLEIRLVDEHDLPVTAGQAGEMIVRSPHPWTLNAGYLGQPDASFRAWRNGWFHTGDMMREDADGWIYFCDRVKDSIRRRGENISSFEVERVLSEHPAVAEAAVVGVESADWGEQDVLAAVVPKAAGRIDPAELTEFAARALPAFMVPRYVRVVASLPKSEATHRIQKSTLREHGSGDDAWDRQADRSAPPPRAQRDHAWQPREGER